MTALPMFSMTKTIQVVSISGMQQVLKPLGFQWGRRQGDSMWGKEQNAGPQALALYTMDDRIVLNKCGLYSYQDTYLTTKTCNYRHYLKDCFIEGAVDFIYGQGNVYFDHCTLNIVRNSGGYIVAPNHAAATSWGYVFMNTTITAPGVPSETSVWLGRPWHDSPKIGRAHV